MLFDLIIKKTNQERQKLIKSATNNFLSIKLKEDNWTSFAAYLYLLYKNYVKEFFPQDIDFWPSISNIPSLLYLYNNNHHFIILRKSEISGISRENVQNINLDIPTNSSMNDIQKIILNSLYFKKEDFIFIFEASKNKDLIEQSLLEKNILYNYNRHKMIMNKLPTKIFLSHKSENKDQVKKYYKTLKLLGFSPWLDENDIHSGEVLHRSLLEGINQSCAIVFFITDAFHDKEFIQREIDLAINRKIKDDNFKIITLVFNNDKAPESLSSYVWKNITNDLDGICEILNALPLKVGDVFFK